MPLCRNRDHICILYSPKRHDDLTEGSGEKPAQAPKFRGNVPAVWRVRLPLRRYFQPAVNRQPGYRWDDSQSKLTAQNKSPHHNAFTTLSSCNISAETKFGTFQTRSMITNFFQQNRSKRTMSRQLCKQMDATILKVTF